MVKMDLNRVTLIGRVAGEPEVRKLPNGQTVVNLTLVTSTEHIKEGVKLERSQFTEIVAFRKLAEVIGKFTKVGSKLYVEGELQTRSWTSKNNEEHYKTEVVASQVIFLNAT